MANCTCNHCNSINGVRVTGKLIDPMCNPLPNTYIVIEALTNHGSATGLKAEYKTDSTAYYSFEIAAGKHKVYIRTSEKDTNKLLGEIHITNSDAHNLYTLQELLLR